MTIHALKTEPRFFHDVRDNGKNFEVRKNDRDYQVGDVLILCNYHPERFDYYVSPYHALMRRVTYVLHGGQFGIDAEHCVLGMEPI